MPTRSSTKAALIDRLDHLVLTVADIPTTCSFYKRALDFEAVEKTVAVAALRQSEINLHQAGREFTPKAKKSYSRLWRPLLHRACTSSQSDGKPVSRSIQIEDGPIARTGPLAR